MSKPSWTATRRRTRGRRACWFVGTALAVVALIAACSGASPPRITARRATVASSGTPRASAGQATAESPSTTGMVQVWLTTADLRKHLTPQPELAFAPASISTALTITVDDRRTYQQVVGFGAAMTDTSAWLIETRLSPAQRDAVMASLFDPRKGIGISFVRVPMGASDFTVTGPYSYDDLPTGQTDPGLTHFSIAHDLSYIVPALEQARRLNPALTLMANPWSPPGWMKANGSMIGGSLLPYDYDPLALYFVKFLKAYQALGVPIQLIGPQNEPGVSPDYPGMVMSARDEAAFVANQLGPALAQAHLHPKVLIYDWNWNDEVYPRMVLASVAADPYIAGTSFHCYAGDPAVMTAMHDAYPMKDVYQTECSTGAAPLSPIELIVRSTRNWSRSVVMWNLALDTQGGPKMGHGCDTCTGLMTIDPQGGSVRYLRDYYEIGHASKFVKPGAYRIGSSSFGTASIEDVAFANPDGSLALIVHNAARASRTFAVQWGGTSFTYTLPAGAMATFTWMGAQARGA